MPRSWSICGGLVRGLAGGGRRPRRRPAPAGPGGLGRDPGGRGPPRPRPRGRAARRSIEGSAPPAHGPGLAGLGAVPQGRAGGPGRPGGRSASRSATIRDELLGDAVVLALQAGPRRPARPGPRGLLLVRPRDRALLEPPDQGRSTTPSSSRGELAGVEPKSQGRGQVLGPAVQGRPAGRRSSTPLLDDGTFAWSNSEAMILGRDRPQGRRAGPAWATTRRSARSARGSPSGPLASLFVNPRLLERAMAEPPRARPRTGGSALLARYVGAVGHVGARPRVARRARPPLARGDRPRPGSTPG